MKRFISIILSLSMIAVLISGIGVSANSGEPVRKYLKPGDDGWIENPVYEEFSLNPSGISGAVVTTPVENSFIFGGRRFVLLDSEEKDGQTYFFIVCDEGYGIAMFDTTGDYGIWNPEDESNIAYWLNTTFWEKGNEGMKIPDAMKAHIDLEHVWVTEPVSGLKLPDSSGSYHDGVTPIQTKNAISLLSRTEISKYAGKFGMECITVSSYTEAYWFIRTAQSGNASRLGFAVGTSGANNPVGKLTELSSASGQPKNTNRYRGVRPCFYLNSSFFEENKIENIGKNVALAIDDFCNAELYKNENWFDNTPSNLTIEGEAIAGETLNVKYEYDGIFNVSDEAFEWYISDTPTGEYTKIDGESGQSLYVSDDMSGKYLKAKVKITTDSLVSPYGEAITKEYKSIISEEQLAQAVKKVNDALAEEIIAVLANREINKIFKLNFSLISHEELEFSKLEQILANIHYNTIEDVRIGYEKGLVLSKLNVAQCPENVEETVKIENVNNILKSEKLGLDLSRYLLLNEEQIVNVQKAMTGKDFVYESTGEELYEIDYEKAFYESVTFEEVDSATRENILDILGAQSKYLGIEYSKLKDAQKEKLATLILGEEYANFEEIKNASKKAFEEVSNEKEIEQKPAKPSGGGGGGGGGGNKSSSDSATKIKSEIQIEEPLTESPKEEIPVSNTEKYSDIEGFEWAEESIVKLTEMGILNGDGSGNFSPADKVTREEFIKMAVIAFGGDCEDKDLPFNDVSEGEWYYDYVKKAYSLGFISGIDEKNFGIGQEITREDIATILYRIRGEKYDGGSVRFIDSDSIADYAKEAVAYMQSVGIINGLGDNSFGPKVSANRAMAAKILYGMTKEMNK